ncbi:hypothetical protein [Frankia sp. CiP1_Cm_nod2]|uniref:hypothetical protein n=1 Tax=Frankia sp. CiP1_Cm_nod2 TaxID=2897161 RepID=UPI002025538D
MNDGNGLYLPGVPGPRPSRPTDDGIVLPGRPARTRRAVLGSALGLLGMAAAGCSRPSDTFDPASEVLPPDAGAATPPPAPGPPPTLANGAADFFGKGLIPQQRATFGLDRTQILPSDNPRFPRLARVALPAGPVNDDVDRQVYNDGNTYGGSQLFLAMEGRPAYRCTCVTT